MAVKKSTSSTPDKISLDRHKREVKVATQEWIDGIAKIYRQIDAKHGPEITLEAWAKWFQTMVLTDENVSNRPKKNRRIKKQSNVTPTDAGTTDTLRKITRDV